MSSAPSYPYSLTSEDRVILESLRVPTPSNEAKRIETLRRSKILDEELRGAPFDRFTSLATRLFGMPYAALTFVEVDQIFFKSKVGFELANVHRNDWFDAYAILPDSSEVFVVPDCALDRRFKDKPFVRSAPGIQFFAGAAIILDDVRLGVLSIMDTMAHPSFTLEDKENLLDLGAAVAQLVGEKLQTALNLSAERANIVVSMMHHLRTPMTSLNFATSLLCNDVQQMNTPGTLRTGIEENKVTNEASQTSAMQSFESSFNEIHASLNQLNVLVDSSLSLGQAIIKCSNNELSKNSIPAMDQRSSKFSECNIIDYLTDIFNNSLPAHKHSLEVEWTIDSTHFVRGTHVTFPDAVMLVVISTFSHMSTESDSLGYYFSFEQTDEDNLEYPELADKMLEGNLSIKVFAKDAKNVPHSSNYPFSMMGEGAAMDADHGPTELPSKQNFLSIDKIIRAINGSAREGVEDISLYCTGLDPGSGSSSPLATRGARGRATSTTVGDSSPSTAHVTSPSSTSPSIAGTVSPMPTDSAAMAEKGCQRLVQEFFVPCKILLSNTAALRSPNQERKKLRLYRAPSAPPGATGPLAATSTYAGGGGGGAAAGSTAMSPSTGLADDDTFARPQALQLQALQEEALGLSTGGSPRGGHVGNGDIRANRSPHRGSGAGAGLGTGECIVPSSEVAANGATEGGTGGGGQSLPYNKQTLRVLIIEDTIPVQKLLARWLHNHGCAVTCANNGKIGLDHLQSGAFDIAFVDFLMPVMLGITTMKLFQQWMAVPSDDRAVQAVQQANRELLFVGMSATALESEQEEAFSYGMHFFCPKPVSLDLLGIILDAKRGCATNDEAVEQICEVTGTNAQEKEEEDRRNAIEQQLKMGGGASTSTATAAVEAPAPAPAPTPTTVSPTAVVSPTAEDTTNNEINGLTSQDNSCGGMDNANGSSRTKWNIFRSHRQISKVAPETLER